MVVPRTRDTVTAMMELSTRRKPAPITKRQREIVTLIAAGCSNEEVGVRLGISPRTAKAHSDVLRQKLGVRRRRQIPIAYRLLTGEDPLASERRWPTVPTPPLIECARGYSGCRGRASDLRPRGVGSLRGSSPPGSYGKYRDSRHSAATPGHPAAAPLGASGRIAGSGEDARGSRGLREDDSGRAMGGYRRPPPGMVHPRRSSRMSRRWHLGWRASALRLMTDCELRLREHLRALSRLNCEGRCSRRDPC